MPEACRCSQYGGQRDFLANIFFSSRGTNDRRVYSLLTVRIAYCFFLFFFSIFYVCSCVGSALCRSAALQCVSRRWRHDTARLRLSLDSYCMSLVQFSLWRSLQWCLRFHQFRYKYNFLQFWCSRPLRSLPVQSVQFLSAHLLRAPSSESLGGASHSSSKGYTGHKHSRLPCGGPVYDLDDGDPE